MSSSKITVYGIAVICVAIAVSAMLTASCAKNDIFTGTGFEKDESSALADPAKRDNLAFVITGSTAGDFEPCGCGGVYEGGLSRRSTMIDKLKKAQPNVVLVDTGDLTCGGEAIQLEFLAQAYSALQYDAIALGEGDLRVGLDDFNKYTRQYKLPIVASNIKFKVPTAVREVIPIERAGIRMAVISVISERWLGIVPEPSRRQVIYESPKKALARLVPQLKKDYDAVILLSHLGTNERKSLKGQLNGIDLWIDNGGHQWTSTPSSQPSQLIQASFCDKEQDPPLLLSWNNDRKIGVTGVTWKDRRFAINLAQLVPVDRAIKEDPRYLEIYDAYKYISRQDAINRIMNPSAAIAGRPAHGFPYESSATCGTCHQEIYDFWKSTKHAAAYATIQKDGRDADSNCLACHTTGYREPGGFEHAMSTPQFKDVGCQMCHRVNLKKHHKKALPPEVAKLEKIRARSNDTTASWQCQRCHVPHRSPKYNYVEYLKKIKCTQALESAKK